MATLGILTCEILELEFAYLLGEDPDITSVAVLEDDHSQRLIEALEARSIDTIRRLPCMALFKPDPIQPLDIIIKVLELGLHNRKKNLQKGIVEAANEIGPHVDGLVLGYGLCGNALEKPEELLAGAGVKVFIPMDTDHPVDDCVGLLIGGRDNYYGEQCKAPGTFFMLPGWTHHWNRIFEAEFGSMSVDMAKRLFKNYDRSLLITSPVMPPEKMRQNVEPFNEMFDTRTECRQGTLQILMETWQAAKSHVKSGSSE